jgi:PelA/Pel-15E family pectate lyase
MSLQRLVVLLIWGQQHDPLTLLPTAARNFELASLASEESAGLLMLSYVTASFNGSSTRGCP